MKSIRATILLFLLGSCPGLAYTNLGNGVYQSDGSDFDTQAAINVAADGNSVIIPNGTYTWTNQVRMGSQGFGKSVDLIGQSKGGVTIVHNYHSDGNYASNVLISVASSSNRPIEIKNLSFQEGSALSGKGHQGAEYIDAQSLNPQNAAILIHDCSFASSGNIDRHIRAWNGGIIIYSNTFNSNGNWDTGVTVDVDTDTYTTPSTQGTLDSNGRNNVYIEDNTFSDVSPQGYSIDVETGRAVIRYNKFINSPVGCHGQEANPWGARHIELYGNTFTLTNPNENVWVWLNLRGGTWTIFNNTAGTLPFGRPFLHMQVQAVTRSSSAGNVLNCPTQYPVPRQLGQGWSGGTDSYSYPEYPADGSGYILDPVYIWGNTDGANNSVDNSYIFGPDFSPDGCGHGLTSAQFLQLNRDFYIGVPKPNYKPYTYPHPLRSDVAPGIAAAPAPPQNRRIAN